MNRRLKQVTTKAVRMNLRGGRYLLDAYHQIVITSGISCTITTRTAASGNHFILEINESDSESRG